MVIQCICGAALYELMWLCFSCKMNETSKTAIRWIVAGCIGTVGLLSACVGGSPNSDESSSGGGAASSSSGASTSGESGSSGSQSSSGASTEDAGVSDASDATTPLPAIACTDEVYPTGTYFSRCRASPSNSLAGGTVPDVGVYLLSGYSGCPGGYGMLYGSAHIFLDNGRRVMRYGRIFKGDNSPNFEVKGTYEFTAEAGLLTRTERCRAGHTDEVETGSYTYDPATREMTHHFADHEEQWTRQP